jgi:hypothetical protein
LTPYHHLADQAPIDALITRIDLVNSQVDNDANTLLNSMGTAGSLANRLAQSINDDGSLKTVALDNALHSIAEHMDAAGYVRMTANERAKLSLIADGATNFGVQFNTISGIISFDQGILDIQPSDTVTWRYLNGSIYADNAFPSSVRHIHYYDVSPVPVNLITPDYINYYTTSIATPYQEGSLRVYLNGIRISQNAPIDIIINDVPTAMTFSEDTNSIAGGMITSGLFTLSSAINADIIIFTDFDVLY